MAQNQKPIIFNNGHYTTIIPTDPHTVTTTDIKTNMRHIHTSIVSRHLATRGYNKILRTPPPPISCSEEILPHVTRHTLALRSWELVDNNLMQMFSSYCTVNMIYLDFSKAFDKVDHCFLLHKLKDLGITGKLGIWFFKFLINRTHFVRLLGVLSQNSPVLSGVPQGTVLGPLLFLLMISNINKEIISSKVISFADDTQVYQNYSNITQ